MGECSVRNGKLPPPPSLQARPPTTTTIRPLPLASYLAAAPRNTATCSWAARTRSFAPTSRSRGARGSPSQTGGRDGVGREGAVGAVAAVMAAAVPEARTAATAAATSAASRSGPPRPRPPPVATTVSRNARAAAQRVEGGGGEVGEVGLSFDAIGLMLVDKGDDSTINKRNASSRAWSTGGAARRATSARRRVKRRVSVCRPSWSVGVEAVLEEG